LRNKLDGWRVLHQTGEHDVEATRRAYRQGNVAAEVAAFVPDLPNILGQASLAICRAGGATLAEIAAAGVPAILCPYPFAAGDHQRHNAVAFTARGAAIRIEARPLEDESGIDELSIALDALLDDASRRELMAASSRTLARPRAASDVADVILSALATPGLPACIDSKSSLGV
jgi:UDP-N-acetylglucosamine--N-acetylmuramyl-(pentapeptide) pyrophosphoryl-undecaprenol N-acetylglucosamine transferase